MVDLFEEVEDTLRADKLKAAGRRVLPWVLGAVFGVVIIGGGYIGWTLWTENNTAKASEAYDALIRGETVSDPEEAFEAFGDIAQKAPAAYKFLALTNQAAIRLEQGREKDAVALFEKAAKAAPGGKAGQVMADSARLKSALAQLDDASYQDTEARLKPLTEEGRPFRAMAREALAIAKLNAGKSAEARADFLTLTADPSAPPSITQRAAAVVSMIDNGSASVVAATVKAAKAAPPPPQAGGLPPELLEQLKAQGIQLEGAPAK